VAGSLSPRVLSVAPMMARTDRHFRFLMRLLAPHAWLYTEMITTGAVLEGQTERLLAYDASEHPVALQLGGSEPVQLAGAAKIGADLGYDEINLNLGCPSGRVQQACFGAALMLDRDRVLRCVRAIQGAVSVPVTVKMRIGVDDRDSYDYLYWFVEGLVAAGLETVIVHARKAWLSGLTPKQNREVPPLDYERVYRIKRDFPQLEVIINGGYDDRDTILAALEHVDGVMLGRAAYENPMLVADLDAALFGTARPRSRGEVLGAYVEYLDARLRRGDKLKFMTRHLHGLFAGEPGARRWRRGLGQLPDGAAGLRALRERMLPDAPRAASL
jgi:tRNA-dihydrouridine synthase A